MKPFIAALSSSCAIGFIIALVNSGVAPADDTATNTTSDVPAASAPAETNSGSINQTTTTQHSSTVSSVKTCTDLNGVTFYRGHTGFDTCMKQMDKKGNQMGGTVDQAPSTDSGNKNSTDTQSTAPTTD